MATIYDCTNQTNRELYGEIKKYYEEAYQCIDKALILDESGKHQEAIGMYEFGLTLIDQALGISIESPTQPDIEWEKTYAMIQKMRKSKKEILGRISDSQVRSHPDAAKPPPSYEEAIAAGPSTSAAAMNSAPTSPSPSYAVPPPVYQPASASIDVNLHNNPGFSFAELNAQLGDMRATGNREIIYSHNNVRLYFIAPDGRVSATSEPDTLIIGRIEDITHDDVLDDTLLTIMEQLAQGDSDNQKKSSRHRDHSRHHPKRHGRHHKQHDDATRRIPPGNGQVYLQVGSWVYPLIPGISPVFRADYGAFILPDVHSEVEGAAVGIILPATADASVYDLLNSILLGVVGVNDLPAKEPVAPTRSRRSHRADHSSQNRAETAFSRNLVRGASYLANNLVRGAGSASRFIDATAPRLMNRMTPATEPQPVNPALKTTVGVAKTVSGTAATVSDYLAGKVGSAASALGQYLAPHIQRGGTRLLASTTKMSPEEASTKVETFLGATSSAVQGIGTVYSGLETAASILGRSLSNNTVQIIEYKYGKPAGEVGGDALSAAGNMYTIHGNYKLLKPTKMAKTVAKSAVSGALHEAAHNEFQGPGPGDGSGFAATVPPTATAQLYNGQDKKINEAEKEKK